MNILRFTILAFALATAGCSTLEGREVLADGERYASQAALPYRLGPGDVVAIQVYGEPDLSGPRTVAADGTISLPLIGSIKALQLTPEELANEAIVRYSAGFLRMPSVTAQVTQYRPFFVLGEVGKPGQYPYVPGMTVLGAIATAEGFNPRANRKFIFIEPEDSDEEKAYQVEPSLRIYPGDTIRVGERYF